MRGDLVMRAVPNRKSKLHPMWDGPFVVLDSTEKDVYQLGTANGYILPNNVNALRLRKLSGPEANEYRQDFWYATKRLRLYDRLAKEQNELREVHKELAEATTDLLRRQKEGLPVSLDRHAELSAKRKAIVATQREIRNLDARPPDGSTDTSIPSLLAPPPAPSDPLFSLFHTCSPPVGP